MHHHTPPTFADEYLTCPIGYVGIHTTNEEHFLHGNVEDSKYTLKEAAYKCDTNDNCHGLLQLDHNEYKLRWNTHDSKGPGQKTRKYMEPTQDGTTYSFCIKGDSIKHVKV